MSTFLIFFISIFLMAGSLHAQTFRQYEQAAAEAMENGRYDAAAVYLRDALKLDPGCTACWFDLGTSLKNLNDYLPASEAFQKCNDLDAAGRYPMSRFWLGSMLKMSGNYTEAEEAFRLFLIRYKNTDAFFRRASHEIEACKKAVLLSKENAAPDSELNHPPAPLNSPYTDFGASVMPDGQISFSSLRNISKEKGKPLFLSRVYKNATAEEVLSLPLDPAYASKHQAYAVWNTDSSAMVFTLCRDSASIYHCELWMSRRKGTDWSTAVRLPEPVNQTPYSSSQPAFGKNGNVDVLYFVSDRLAGKGDDDIWMAEENNGRWIVSAVSAQLNTPGKESSPFWDQHLGVLWFASDWHYGTGGLDIFGYKTGAGVFRLPAPFNTCTNDWGLLIGRDRKQAWLTSNRLGSQSLKSATCCNDLWTLSWNDSFIQTLIPPAIISETPALVIGNPKLEIPSRPDESIPSNPIPPTATPSVTLAENVVHRLNFYFHNDEPDPRSRKSKTTQSYLHWYHSYLAQKQSYLDSSASGNAAIEAFFEKQLRPLTDSLQKLHEFLNKWNGNAKLEISLSGYCSPLTGNDYNLQLSARRIHSVLLELERNHPDWKEWIRSGKLIVKTNPKGEENAAPGLSDRADQTPVSVYSTEAAAERRVVLEWKMTGAQ